MSTLVGTSLYVVPSSVCALWSFAPVYSKYFPVVANEGQRIDIPDGCTLENRTLPVLQEYFMLAQRWSHALSGLLSGNLNMIVRLIFTPKSTVY